MLHYFFHVLCIWDYNRLNLVFQGCVIVVKWLKREWLKILQIWIRQSTKHLIPIRGLDANISSKTFFFFLSTFSRGRGHNEIRVEPLRGLGFSDFGCSGSDLGRYFFVCLFGKGRSTAEMELLSHTTSPQRESFPRWPHFLRSWRGTVEVHQLPGSLFLLPAPGS